MQTRTGHRFRDSSQIPMLERKRQPGVSRITRDTGSRLVQFVNRSFRSVKVRTLLAFVLIGVLSATVVGVSLIQYASINARQEYLKARKLVLVNLTNVLDIALVSNIETLFQNYASNQDDFETLSKLAYEPLAGNHAIVVRVHRLLRETITNANYYDQIEDIVVYYPDNGIVISAKGLRYVMDGAISTELNVTRFATETYLHLQNYSRLFDYRDSGTRFAFRYRFPRYSTEQYAVIFAVVRDDFIAAVFAKAGINDDARYIAVHDVEAEPVYLGAGFKGHPELMSDPFTYTATMSNGWTVSMHVDIHPFQARIRAIRRVFYAMLFAAVAVAVLLALLFSRKVYSPLGRIVGRIGAANDATIHARNEFTLIEEELDGLTTRVQELETTVEKNLPAIKANFVRDLISGRMLTQEALTARSGLIDIEWDYDSYRAIAFGLSRSAMEELDPRKAHFSLYHLADAVEQAVAAGSGARILATDYDAHLVCAVAGYYSASESEFWNAVECAVNTTTSRLEMDVSAYIGATVSRPLELKRSFDEALVAMSYGYAFPKRKLLRYSDIVARESGGQTLDPDAYTALDHLVRHHDRDGLESLLDAIRSEIETKDVPIAECRRFAAEVRRTIGSYAEEISCPLELPDEQSFSDLTGLVLDAERTMQDHLDQKATDRYASRISAVCTYIDGHVGDILSLDAVAERFRIPVSTLSRSFKSVTGKSFLAYVTERRMESARVLLRESNMQVKDIATQCGFNSDSYFIYQFKSVFGYTPNMYRQLADLREQA